MPHTTLYFLLNSSVGYSELSCSPESCPSCFPDLYPAVCHAVHLFVLAPYSCHSVPAAGVVGVPTNCYLLCVRVCVGVGEKHFIKLMNIICRNCAIWCRLPLGNSVCALYSFWIMTKAKLCWNCQANRMKSQQATSCTRWVGWGSERVQSYHRGRKR